MADLKDKDILHIAKLSNLYINNKEIENYKKQLSEVIDYINLLDEVDTKEASDTAHSTDLSNILREDEINASSQLSQEEALLNASRQHNGYFVSKLVIEEKDY